MDDEAVEGVADAHAPRLGVADHGAAFRQVAVRVEIGVDDARAGLDDGNAGVLAHEADQPGTAAGDHHIDVTHGPEQRRHGFVVGGQQGEGRRVDALAAECFVEQGGDGFVGAAGVAAAFQHAGVARPETQREDVGRDVRTRLADHSHDAERHADLADRQSVGAGPLVDRRALRCGEPGDGLHVGGDACDAFGRQPQPVAQGRVGGHRREVEGVGLQQAVGVCPEQPGGRRDGAAQRRGVGAGQFGSRAAGGGEESFVFRIHFIPDIGNRSESAA